MKDKSLQLTNHFDCNFWFLLQIHRRKIRAWQMICIMSRFVSNDIVGQVMDSVHICLHVSLQEQAEVT